MTEVPNPLDATGADLGIAFDGDGDRVLFVDGDGVVCDGDDLLYVLACDWQASGRLQGPVVGTLMTNYALERAFAQRGIAFIRAKVGDRYVHQQLIANGGVLGGEASGHLLCLDRTSTGDGIRILNAAAAETLPKQMTWEWTELFYLQMLEGSAATWAFAGAVVLVFLVLAAQYESWSMPLAIVPGPDFV